MKNLFYIICMAAVYLYASCSRPTDNAGMTQVTVPMPASDNGYTAYLTDYDNDILLDSAVITDGMVTIILHTDTPRIARVIAAGGRRFGTLIIEPGVVTIDSATRLPSGTMLNDRLSLFAHAQDSLMTMLDTIADDSTKSALCTRLRNLESDALASNRGNALGYYLVLQQGYDMPLQQIDSLVAQYPETRNGVRMQRLIDAARRISETSPGAMFKDFEVVDDTVRRRLSNHVGRGHYTLVDFWASWCGPCMREMANLRQIYDLYTPEGLELLGVAVWDNRNDSQRAIERLQLPWHQILDAQRIPTDIYGITGIPCLILFDPDGKIIYRGEGGEPLRNLLGEVFDNIS